MVWSWKAPLVGDAGNVHDGALALARDHVAGHHLADDHPARVLTLRVSSKFSTRRFQERLQVDHPRAVHQQVDGEGLSPRPSPRPAASRGRHGIVSHPISFLTAQVVLDLSMTTTSAPRTEELTISRPMPAARRSPAHACPECLFHATPPRPHGDPTGAASLSADCTPGSICLLAFPRDAPRSRCRSGTRLFAAVTSDQERAPDDVAEVFVKPAMLKPLEITRSMRMLKIDVQDVSLAAARGSRRRG